jgi:hypothetical protein
VHYLTEDPTLVAGTLAVLALICLILLKTTQRGKFLVWGVGFGLAAAFVVLFEQVTVTDNERIEAVVVELRNATARSDAEAVLALTTPDLRLEPSIAMAKGPLARAFIKSQLDNTKFDFLSIRHLEIASSPQSRRGSAQFEVLASGSWQSYNWATSPGQAVWSIGVEEMPDKSWKINRITAVKLPGPIAKTLGIGGNGG